MHKMWVMKKIKCDSQQRDELLLNMYSQGRAGPLCARIKSANREVSEGKADV